MTAESALWMSNMKPKILLAALVAVLCMGATYTITQLTENATPGAGTIIEIYDPTATPKSGKITLDSAGFRAAAGIDLADYMPNAGTNTFATDLLAAAASQVPANQTNVAAANPTATVATTAVNGTAETFMRSDASPAIPAAFIQANQTNATLASLGGAPLANPTFTGTANFENIVVSGTFSADALALPLAEGPVEMVIDGGTGDTNLVSSPVTSMLHKIYTNAFTGTKTVVLSDSPVLTGDPTVPTPAENDNDTSIATTAYVQTEIAGLGGGSTNVTDFSASNAAFTNIWASSDGSARANIRIGPRLGGSLSLESPESNTAGTGFGAGSVDLQIGRNGAAKVASGVNSFTAGTNNTASGPGAVALGVGTTASGGGALAVGSGGIANSANSFVAGYNTYAALANSVSTGDRSKAMLYGEVVHSSGVFAAAGDCQSGMVVARVTTSGNTPANLALDSGYIALPNHTTWAYRSPNLSTVHRCRNWR